MYSLIPLCKINLEIHKKTKSEFVVFLKGLYLNNFVFIPEPCINTHLDLFTNFFLQNIAYHKHSEK